MQYGFYEVITLIGALCFFLYGMRVMSDALLELAGSRLRSILASATVNRFVALFTGFFITAAVQSSSATTLMVISFVNANLLTLTESIGIIMGANIGTTVTAWLISILGFKVKISVLALPLVGAGFLMTLAKPAKTKAWGNFIVGFALLFLGLQYLKEAVPDISSNPDILSFLSEYASMGYASVILFLVIGTLLTLVVQSSSASMALTLLMCYQGWISFEMAVAMVVGGNLGTTITAMLAAIVANFQAKRAAMAHLLFNAVGAIWILIVFYPAVKLVDAVMQNIYGQSPLHQTAAVPIALSLFHTGFNLLNAFLLIGFSSQLVTLVEKLVPATPTQEPEIDSPKFLNRQALQYPETGLKALLDESMQLLEKPAYKVLTHGLWVHREELENQRPLIRLLENSSAMTIDIDNVYNQRIKSINNHIIAFAAELQHQCNLSLEQQQQVQKILIANRQLVRAIKETKSLHKNLHLYMDSNNETIQHEYNLLRKRILKVVRQIQRLSHADDPQPALQMIKRHAKKAEKLDVLVTGRVNELIRAKKLSPSMATSLINDSFTAQKITLRLAEIAKILYSRPADHTIPVEELVVSEY